MGDVLFKIIEMSISGGIAILAVLLLRLIFRRFPKKLLILFWLIVAFRLVCPFNLNLPTSARNIKQLFVKNDTSVVEVDSSEEKNATSSKMNVLTPPDIDQKKEDHSLKRVINSDVTVKVAGKATPTVAVKAVLASIWLSVAIGLFIFFLVRYFNFYSKARWNSRAYDGSYYLTEIESPFVIGFLSPKIFVPIVMNEDEREYILNHEWTHIKNKDGLTKLICYIILCIHWFNPLVWVAYFMLCADMEMRVDEETTSAFDTELLKEYCMSIVLHATSAYKSTSFMQNTAFSGFSFGGMEAKLRVSNLLKSRKISKVLQVIVLIFALVFCFLVSASAYDLSGKDGSSSSSPEKVSTSASDDVAEDGDKETAIVGDDVFEAYKKIVEEYECDDKAELRYELVHINEDEIPELIINDPGYFIEGYTYSDGEVRHIMDHWSYGIDGNYGYDYVPYENVILNLDTDMGGALEWVALKKMDDRGSVVDMYEGTLNLRYFDSEPDVFYPDDYILLDTPRYYMGTTELTQDEFMSYIPDHEYNHLGNGIDLDTFVEFMENKQIPTYPTVFYEFTDCTSWLTADSHAEAMRADLASLDSEEDWEYVTSMIRQHNATDYIFFVGAQRDEDGVIRWLSGKPVTDHWLPGEPSGTAPTQDGRIMDENYVVLFYRDSDDTFYLMDVPDNILDAAPSYEGHLGYITESRHE